MLPAPLPEPMTDTVAFTSLCCAEPGSRSDEANRPEMAVIAGPFHVIVGLLLVAGVAKLARPRATKEVAKVAGIPASVWVVRVFALAEVAVPTAAFAVGILYLVFAGFVLTLKVRGVETAGCGCFGRESEEPPGSLHIAVDVTAALIAAIAALAPVTGFGAVLSERALWGAPYIGFVALGVWLLVVMLTDLPRLTHLAGEVSALARNSLTPSAARSARACPGGGSSAVLPSSGLH